MTEIACPGWPASWVNAWLAAVGATVLHEQVRLSWTDDAEPKAMLTSSSGDPIEQLAESWPTLGFLEDLPIAEHWQDAAVLRRKVHVEEFAARASAARSHTQAWTLSSTMTDLCVERDGEVRHAPFDPAGPGTIKWLHHRLVKVHRHIESPVESLTASLSGRGARVQDNGLGFDQTRLGSLNDHTKMWVDPIVETLAFFGLAILPVRGRGADRQLDRSADLRVRQRGWRQSPGRGEPASFHWPAWRQPLDRDGIDALLDVWSPERRETWPRFGIHAAWRSVQFQRRGDSDTTRAYGAYRL